MEHTLRGQIPEGRSTVTLHLGAGGIRQRNEDLADTHLQKLALEFIYKKSTLIVPSSRHRLPLKAKTATHAVISLCTFIGTSRTSSLIDCTAPALTIANLFFSELAARLRSVEMA